MDQVVDDRTCFERSGSARILRARLETFRWHSRVTVARLPDGSAKRRKAGSEAIRRGRPAIVIRDEQSGQQRPGIAAQLDRLKPGRFRRKAFDRREMTTTFSRPVSRLTRRIFRGGRDVSTEFICQSR
jgi:hypothetical protein